MFMSKLKSLLRSQRLSSVLKWINIGQSYNCLCDYVDLSSGTVSDPYKLISKIRVLLFLMDVMLL